jgi:hypothetical protein
MASTCKPETDVPRCGGIDLAANRSDKRGKQRGQAELTRATRSEPGSCAAHRLHHLGPDSTRKGPYMRHTGVVVAALLCMACAPGGAFVKDVNTTPTISEAERLITDAQRAGADSLATEAITAARLALESARAFEQGGRRSRAQVEALRAQAEARYARAVAERTLAEREQVRARDALAALPPGGGQ